MLRSLWFAGACLVATAAVAEPFVAPISGSYSQAFGGFGSDGTEALFEFAVPPLDRSGGSQLVRIDFEGTVTQSLSFTFSGSDSGGESYCAIASAAPSFGFFVGGEPLAAVDVENGAGVCGGIGEAVSDTQSMPVLLSAVVDPTSPSFEGLSEGFPLDFLFRDANWWDLEGAAFDSFVYATSFAGTITVEAFGGAPNEVPEPAAFGLLGLGALALARRRRAVSLVAARG